MAEPQARSGPRGRGSGRGGRGGFRGGRPRGASGKDANPSPSYEEEGDIGQLKKQYATELSSIREMFPDWTDEDLVFALEETDGDLEGTIERISEGNVSQWGEVKKKTKDRAQKKGKDAHENTETKGAGRGHGRGTDAARGRSRGAERGRAGRGRAASAAVNGARKNAPATTAADGATTAEKEASWDTPADKTAIDENAGSVSPDRGSWEVVTPSDAIPPATDAAKTKKPDGTRSWASMLKPTPKPKQPAPAKPKTAPVPPADPVAKEAVAVPAAGDTEIGKAPPAATAKQDVPRSPSLVPSETAAIVEPTQDELTKTNLELVQDVSNPPPAETVASNAGTDQRGTATPSQTVQQRESSRPGLGGYATTAQKATSGSTRSSSYQRRVKDQQEAVVMPGNHAVDRAAVQFGSLGLGSQEDLDDEREEPETRAQPPQSSPIAPRASLPPAQQTLSADSTATSRPPGLPAVTQAPIDAAATQSTGSNYGYNQFGSLYSNATQADATAQNKQYDPLGPGQQAGVQGFDNYPAHSQAGQPMHGHAAYSSAGNEYSSYYSSDNQRAYQNYYGYGQQAQPQPHETAAAQQKMGTGFGGANGDQASTTSTSQAQAAAAAGGAAAAGRFGTSNEAQPSGHSTPNPPHSQQQPGQGPQSHHVGQGHGPTGGHGYPYGGNPYYSHYSHYPSYINQVGNHSYGAERPPFDDARRYDEYLTQGNQFGYGGRHGGYNAPYGKGFGQPHSYGMSSQSPFDPHSGSPANAGPYGQPHNMPGRDNTLGSYGRAGSTQPSEAQSHTTSTFGGMSDVFNRGQSGYSTQTSQQGGSQQAGAEDSSRSYNESSKLPGGPSPAPGPGGARPGSAANLGGQSIPTTQAQGYGGYPSQMGMHGQQSQQYGGLGGLGAHGGHHQGQGHQNTGYGNYGSGFGGNYYNSNSRGGWGGNYGH